MDAAEEVQCLAVANSKRHEPEARTERFVVLFFASERGNIHALGSGLWLLLS